MEINTEDIWFSFEYGSQTESFIQYIVLHDNTVWEVTERGTSVSKVNKNIFRENYGISWIKLLKNFKKNQYFIPLNESGTEFSEDTEEDIGLYLENDHPRLVYEGVLNKKLKIID